MCSINCDIDIKFKEKNIENEKRKNDKKKYLLTVKMKDLCTLSL